MPKGVKMADGGMSGSMRDGLVLGMTMGTALGEVEVAESAEVAESCGVAETFEVSASEGCEVAETIGDSPAPMMLTLGFDEESLLVST